jgi:hypothetical protein
VLGVELDDRCSVPRQYQFEVTVVVGTSPSKIIKGLDVMRATVKIAKITRDSKLKLRFIAQKYSEKLVEAFTIGSISIEVSSLQN